MKVLHLPYTFFPDPAGGTEVYVDALARAQRRAGIRALVAAPGASEDYYEHEGLPVWRFPVAAARNLPELYGEGDPIAAEGLARVLRAAQPDLVHLHAFSSGVSLRSVRAAKQFGIPVVFSYHTPTVSCQRGTLLHWGEDVCDGTLEVRRCAQCTLNAHGLSRTLSRAVGSLPPRVGSVIGSAGLSGGVWTALRMAELTELRHATFHSVMAEVDYVVALCEWVKQVLLGNGVSPTKIGVCRQGLVQENGVQVQTLSAGPSREHDPLRIGYFGRLDPTKGVHVLIDALRSAPDLDVHLDIHGVVQGEGGAVYLERLKRAAAGDSRIEFREPVPARDVVARLQNYDVLAAPSQWLETGPMVVLEAFAAGVPVIGSDLGGIAELVRHGVDGLLVAPASISAWTAAMRELAAGRGAVARLQSGIRPPRRISQAAQEIDRIYRRLVPAQVVA